VPEMADFFRDFGVINDAWVARKPPGFGFVFFDSERDAVRIQYPYWVGLTSPPRLFAIMWSFESYYFD
jgi:hypothetical protein